MPINGGYSSFSSGPSITQEIPKAQRTPTVPTQYGIPTMSMDSFSSVDARHSEVPEFHPGVDALHPAHTAPSTGSVLERYKNQAENPTPKKPAQSAKDDDGDDEDMPAEDGAFQKLEGKLAHQKGVYNPAGLAASIGKKKLGEKEYDHRISEGEKHKE